MKTTTDPWPPLDYLAAKDVLEAIHMQTQVVGKVKLALTPAAPEWQTVPLWVGGRGLTTGLMRAGDRGLEIAFDFVEHRLGFTTTDGGRSGFDLEPRPLCDFTAAVMSALADLGIQVTINPMTVEVPNPVRCDEHRGCEVYDRDVAERLFAIWSSTALVLEEHRARFWGKQTQVGMYWGTFDLSVARYNLVPVEASANADLIHRVAMDSEQSEVGFWPGSERYPKPAFFSYTYPKPAGIEQAHVTPAVARWDATMGEFLLDYDDVRNSGDPRAAILEFASSTYGAGAERADWDLALLDRGPST